MCPTMLSSILGHSRAAQKLGVFDNKDGDNTPNIVNGLNSYNSSSKKNRHIRDFY